MTSGFFVITCKIKTQKTQAIEKYSECKIPRLQANKIAINAF